MLLIGLLLLAVVGMFFISRRNKKAQGSVSDFRTKLAAGDEVMTASGQLGVVVAKDGDAVTISSAGTLSTWVVAAIQQVPPQFTAAADAAFGRTPAVDPADDETSAIGGAELDVEPATPTAGLDDDAERPGSAGPDIDGGPTTPDERR